MHEMATCRAAMAYACSSIGIILRKRQRPACCKLTPAIHPAGFRRRLHSHNLQSAIGNRQSTRPASAGGYTSIIGMSARNIILLTALAALAGVLAGWWGTVHWLAASAPDLPPEAAVENVRTDWEQRWRDSDAALAEALVQISRLRNQLESDRRARQEAATAAAAKPLVEGPDMSAEPPPPPGAARWAERRTAMFDGQVRLWTQRLGLSDQQQQQIGDWLRARMESVESGPGGGMGRVRAELEAELANILTPQQQADWEELRTEQLQLRAETEANVALGALALQLGLDGEQRQTVFDALYDLAWTRNATPPEEHDPAFFAEARAALIERLSGTLTPAQLEAISEMPLMPMGNQGGGGGRRGGEP
jgi:Spy/CpxP family protein refolding chaperone